MEGGDVCILVGLVEIFAKGGVCIQHMIGRCSVCVCVWGVGEEGGGGTRPIAPLSMQHAIFLLQKKKNVTHRSNSSLGSFLLMTASSLFVNI